MTEDWEATRFGGFRRVKTAQSSIGAEAGEGTFTEARGIASPDVEVGEESPSAVATSSSGTRRRFGVRVPGRGQFKWSWHEELGLPPCPYLIRWRIETPWGSVRLHHWMGPDDDRAKHDHPWGFRTFVLKGGYTDLGADGDEHLQAPATCYRPATHQHTVVPDQGGCWTVIVTGPQRRQWGFWVRGKFVKSYKYFYKFGHHPCD